MNTAYPLFPVAVLILLAYAISSLFSRWGIYPGRSHRKFWNVLLLLAFLFSGLAGLLSVVKVNYKLQIPYYDQLLKWHVSFGIGMVIIVFFHLSWHWKYYFRLKKGKAAAEQIDTACKSQSQVFFQVGFFLFLLGLLAVINQLVFMREFISVMVGNELILGIVMAVWLLLTGWGAYAGRKGIPAGFNLWRVSVMLLVLALLPLLSIAMLYWLKSQLFPPGTITGVGDAVVGALLLLYPVCFLSGYLFTLFSTGFSGLEHKNRIGKAYAFESFGSLVGGLFFSIILGRFFNSSQIFGITAALVLAVEAWICRQRIRKVILISGAVLIPLGLFLLNADTHIKQWLYPSQKIIRNRSTPYGNLIVTRQADQFNFYENHSLQMYTGNFMANEEAVHFAMLQHKHPQNVLLLSGGISGMIHEINKYEVEKITYLELNPGLYKYWKDKIGRQQDFSRVEFIRSDMRTFLARTHEQYDVILMNLPPPSTLGNNRFYTDEFFRIVKLHCSQQTVVSVSLPSTMNYAEENMLQEAASLWKTLGTYFPNELVLIGEKNYFLASSDQLSANITALVDRRGIENEYVNPYYLEDFLLEQRSHQLETEIKNKEPYVALNRDFHPYMFIKHTQYWLSHFGTSYVLLVLIPFAVFLLVLFRLDVVSAGLYTGGFSAASLELCLMLAFQVFFGSLYLATALFFAVFMGGLALGSLQNRIPGRLPKMKNYALLQILIALFALLIPLLIELIGSMGRQGILLQLFFFGLVFLLALGIGYEFYLASQLRTSGLAETSGINYSTDLLGSAFGAFLTSIILLPRLGLLTTCLIIGLLNIFSAARAFCAVRS
jgi:spermidine synthase